MAAAQPAEEVTATIPDDTSAESPPRVGYGALPGGIHALTAETLPPGTAVVAALSGFGYRSGLLGPDHKFTRELGDVAVAYAPIANLVFALSLDGRHDKHTGFMEAAGKTTDDSYVGDPHLMVRYARPFGKLSAGAQLGVWAPGNNAPSLVASAISVDARGLVSLDVGFGVLSLDAGYRIDNSLKSAPDANSLLIDDQVSLGVSQFSAVLAAASLRVPVGSRAYIEAEGSSETFVGSNSPGSILRGSALVGVALSNTFSLIGFVEAAKVPGITVELNHGDPTMPLPVTHLPYEPTVTGGIGLQARFGGPKKPAIVRGPVIVEKPVPVPVVVDVTADVSGVVFDEQGKPIIGAKVTITLKSRTGTSATDGKGVYSIPRLKIGETIDGKTNITDGGAEVSVELANRKPGSTTLTLVPGANSVPPITLDPILPPGELRGRIINIANSRPVGGATIAVEPGGITQTSDPDGKFTVGLPPGRYKITVTAKNLAPQTLDVLIEQNGVAIKNIELHK